MFLILGALKAKFIPEVGVHLHGFVVQILLVLVAHLNVSVVEQGIPDWVDVDRIRIQQGASAAWWWRNVEVDAVVEGFVAEVFVHGTAGDVLFDDELFGDQFIEFVLDVVLIEGEWSAGGKWRWRRRWWSSIGTAFGQHWRHQAIRGAGNAIASKRFAVGSIDGIGGKNLFEFVPVFVQVGLGG